MREDTKVGCNVLAVCFVGVVLFACSMTAAEWSGRHKGQAEATAAERQKAIEAGAGRWVIDPTTGERSFIYGVESK
jgi:hypothetical protein